MVLTMFKIPFKTCTVTDVLAISVNEQVYFPESEVCALAINNLLLAPFVNISVFTLKKKIYKNNYFNDLKIAL